MPIGVDSPGNKESDLLTSLQALAAPGAMFTRSGNIPSGSYLLNGNVVSNTTGFPIRLLNAELIFISVASEAIDTYDIDIIEFDGSTENVLATINVVNARTADFTPASPIPITFGNELRAKLVSGSGKNVVCIAFTTGEVPA